MATDLADRLGHASELVELDQADLARALDTNRRTIARWLHREASRRPDARERVLELLAVLASLITARPGEPVDHQQPRGILSASEPLRLLPHYGQPGCEIGGQHPMLRSGVVVEGPEDRLRHRCKALLLR